jgi:serine/threonine protein phosphatase PrpC
MFDAEFSTYSMSVVGRKPWAKHTENQDRVLCRAVDIHGDQGAILVVADGITKCPFGGSVARWVVEQHLAKDNIAFADGDPADCLHGYLNRLHSQFYAEFSSGPDGFLDSGASLSVALLLRDTAYCLWAGDSPIYISRRTVAGFDTELISRPDQDSAHRLTNAFGAGSPFELRVRRLSISRGDIVTITSDGVAIDEWTLSCIYRENTLLKVAIEKMIRSSTRGRSWDDLTVAVGQSIKQFRGKQEAKEQ